jgi:hypothetical protein
VFIAVFCHAQVLHDVVVQHVGVRRPIHVFDENERTYASKAWLVIDTKDPPMLTQLAWAASAVTAVLMYL